MPHNNGGDWVRLPKRMAIYLRDGFLCLWCGHKPDFEHGYKLTLDHLHPDGGNGAHNVVTCCQRCNSSRQDMPIHDWLIKLGTLCGETQEKIAHRVLVALSQPLDMKKGKELAHARRPRMKEKEDDLGSSHDLASGTEPTTPGLAKAAFADSGDADLGRVAC